VTHPHAVRSLSAVAAEYWAALLARFPLLATTLALPDHQDRLPDLTPEGREEWRSTVMRLRARAEDIPASQLSEARRVTHAMLLHELEAHGRAVTLDLDDWTVDQLVGPHVTWLELARIHRIADEASAESYLARVRAMPGGFDQLVANMKRGLASGRVAATCIVARVLQHLDDVLAAGPEANRLLVAFASRPQGLDEAAWTGLRERLRACVRDDVMPALQRYRDFLRDQVLPASRRQPGLWAVPGGDAAYRAAIWVHATRDAAPHELHEIGRKELQRARAEMAEIAAIAFPDRTVEAVLRELREDRRHSFGSREEIVATATAAIERAVAAAPRAFDELPSQPCVVLPIERNAEKAAPAAYYLAPAPDGSRPGACYVNTRDASSRPRHDAEAMAFNQGVPGAHLLATLAQDMTDVPAFQRHPHVAAFMEGWGFYAERLAHELGLYTGPIDVLGMLTCDAWRAARVVADTGLHAQRWTRSQAIGFMASNTAASMGEIANEVDRYIAWPGQALAAEVGQLEIFALRRQAEATLGDRFDLKALHGAMLRHGGVPLPILRETVTAWIADAARR
jgi:uncharacterized protein (DUF885 family)